MKKWLILVGVVVVLLGAISGTSCASQGSSQPATALPVDREIVLGIRGAQDVICYARAGQSISGYIQPQVEGIMFIIYNPQDATVYNQPHATSKVYFNVYCDTDGYYRMWFKNENFVQGKTVWLHYQIE